MAMNKQGPDGIDWTNYSWGVIAGCYHDCQWIMPNGDIAVCYAMDIAEGFNLYPNGFRYHYFKPEKLHEPLKVKTPSKIFPCSMGDLMGQWVADNEIEQVIEIMRQAYWHTFQILTKNAPRLLNFNFPGNCWLGVSSAPDYMHGKQLNRTQQNRYMHKALKTLSAIENNITWMSFEPLSWDVASLVSGYPEALNWAVIGAASNGRKKFQPEHEHVQKLLDVLDSQGAKVFFKGNLKWSPWRENYPDPLPQMAQIKLF